MCNSWRQTVISLHHITECSAPSGKGRGGALLGSRPCVHAGFLGSWQANGLNERIIGRITDILAAAAADCTAGSTGRRKVYVTGAETACQLLYTYNKCCAPQLPQCG